MACNIVNGDVIKRCKGLVPELSYSKNKGQNGRVGVIGGSKDFTGAPYFAGMSALRTGADQVYIFCSQDAAQPIQSYSPDPLVLPLLDVEMTLEEQRSLLNYLHSAVIGPGIGKDMSVMIKIVALIPILKSLSIPLVLDANALCILVQYPTILKDYSSDVYLTPNIREFSWLCEAFLAGQEVSVTDYDKSVPLLSKAIGPSTTILIKGERDIIVRGDIVLNCETTKGSPRRSGGQGDVVSGCLGIFAFWATQVNQTGGKDAPQLNAALAASTIVRVCNRFAFEEKGRGMTTMDMLDKLPVVFDTLFDDKSKYVIA